MDYVKALIKTITIVEAYLFADGSAEYVWLDSGSVGTLAGSCYTNLLPEHKIGSFRFTQLFFKKNTNNSYMIDYWESNKVIL